ncbi:MAG: 16S rRNA (uracil(1498)-N(3))-methyltransferase [Clostridium sp.]
MFHFFADQGQIEEKTITITGSDVNHIKNVLRMKEGEKALISNRIDRDYLCRVETITSEAVSFEILEEMEEGTELPARIYLFQGLPKSDKMELIIQKAVELGVYMVIPVSMKRAVVKLDAKKEETKVKRWNAIAESAAKQSKRIVIPEVSGVMSLKEALDFSANFDLRLLPYECAKGMTGTKEQLSHVKPGTDIGILIGPEGGFEEEEVALAEAAGVHTITLGKRILRTETAGLCILSVLMFQLEN